MTTKTFAHARFLLTEAGKHHEKLLKQVWEDFCKKHPNLDLNSETKELGYDVSFVEVIGTLSYNELLLHHTLMQVLAYNNEWAICSVAMTADYMKSDELMQTLHIYRCIDLIPVEITVVNNRIGWKVVNKEDFKASITSFK